MTRHALPQAGRAALWYREHLGWSVIALHGVRAGRCTCDDSACDSPGKHPLAPWTRYQHQHATPDEITHWWRGWPQANVGVVTGRVSGIVVLDVDPRAGGDEALRDLEAQYGPLPETPEVLTGGGGRHIYMAYPDGGGASAVLAPGLELKADGSLVVAPPSIHASGRQYEWEVHHWPHRLPLAPVPDWVLALARRSGGQGRPPEAWREHVRRTYPEGERHNAVRSLVAHLLRRYVDPLVVLDLALAWNTTHCTPPLPEGEVVAIVDGVAKLEAARRRRQGGGRSA